MLLSGEGTCNGSNLAGEVKGLQDVLVLGLRKNHGGCMTEQLLRLCSFNIVSFV